MNKHPDALPDGTLSKSTAKRLAVMCEGDMARALHWFRQQKPPTEHLSALEEAVAGYVEPKAETVRREQQPAGDGGALSILWPLIERLQDDAFNAGIAAKMYDKADALAKLKAAIAALTAAGRGGEGDWVLVPREPTDAMKDAAAKHYGYTGYVETYRAMLAAAPQQPVGVTDAVRGVIALLRQREPDNGEKYTEHDEGYDQASSEIADMLERILTSHQQAAPSVSEDDHGHR